MDVIIVDDEPLARARLERMLADETDYTVVGSAGNGQEALALVMTADPDLVLLDIEMPEHNGVTVAKQLLALEDPPAVIFCTAHEQHALQAFAVNAVDYLLKPVRKDQLLQALQKAQSLNRLQRQLLAEAGPVVEETRHHVSARSSRGVELIPLDQVHFFVADQKYVTVHHENGCTLIDDTLKELQGALGDRFVRVHRNALVAVARIAAMEKRRDGQFVLRLLGTDERPVVSRRHVAALRDLLKHL